MSIVKNSEKKNNSARLMLIEIIISVLFFSIISSVCLQAFVKSKKLEERATFNRMAVNEMTSVCNLLEAAADKKIVVSDCDKLTTFLEMYYPGVVNEGGVIKAELDAPLMKNDCVLYVTPIGSGEKYDLFNISIKASDDMEYVLDYSLMTDYIAGGQE